VARYFDVHPDNPQPRAIRAVADIIRADGLIAYPTDSVYALGCRPGNHAGTDRIREIRRLDDRHHFTLVCRDFAQLGQLVQIDNAVFRAVKAATPGRYTFILPATREVPRRLQHPRKRTVGVRIPDHAVTQALLAELGEPLVSSTLLLPGEEEPLTQGWEIKERLDRDRPLGRRSRNPAPRRRRHHPLRISGTSHKATGRSGGGASTPCAGPSAPRAGPSARSSPNSVAPPPPPAAPTRAPPGHDCRSRTASWSCGRRLRSRMGSGSAPGRLGCPAQRVC